MHRLRRPREASEPTHEDEGSKLAQGHIHELPQSVDWKYSFASYVAGAFNERKAAVSTRKEET
jgi:hypothetical protein